MNKVMNRNGDAVWNNVQIRRLYRRHIDIIEASARHIGSFVATSYAYISDKLDQIISIACQRKQ
jgi:hypothetical protein